MISLYFCFCYVNEIFGDAKNGKMKSFIMPWHLVDAAAVVNFFLQFFFSVV